MHDIKQIRGLSKTIKLYHKVVRRTVLGNRPTIHVEEAHEFFLESYPTNSPRRIVQRIYIGGLPTNKTNILFGNDFHTWHKHV